MKLKKTAAVVLAAALLGGTGAPSLAADAASAFSDVSADSWYAPYVEYCVRDGIMTGVEDGLFLPSRSLTQAECLTLSGRLYTLEHDGENGTALLTAAGLADGPQEATRLTFANALAAAAGELEHKNDAVIIPDLQREGNESVYALYEAGILNGTDNRGTFNPDKTLTRAEAAAMVARVLEPDLRVSLPAASEGSDSNRGGNGGGPGGMRGGNGGGMGMTSTDPAIQAVLDENAEKFAQHSFTDPDTGFALEYSLYTPAGYDGTEKYPLLMFIPDSTGAGKTAQQIVAQYYGATVWVTEEDQAKHPAFVMVPAFTETVVNDNWEVSDQVETAVKLLAKLREDYAIDENRIYATGQSMGCMTSLYLNSKYPDLFAASMFVSGQWDISVLKPLEGKTFFYITAGGDANASGGQSEVMEMLDADDIPYAYGAWNAQNSDEAQVAAVNELLAQGLPINMVRFETGSVFKEGESGMEHMASFNYGYKLSAVRDWLFEQVKK